MKETFLILFSILSLNAFSQKIKRKDIKKIIKQTIRSQDSNFRIQYVKSTHQKGGSYVPELNYEDNKIDFNVSMKYNRKCRFDLYIDEKGKLVYVHVERNCSENEVIIKEFIESIPLKVT